MDQSLYGTGAVPGGDRNIVNQANLLQTPAVAQEVAERIGFRGDPDALLAAIRVTPSAGSDFLVVRAEAYTAARAAALANGFAAAFIDLRAAATQQQIRRALATARRQLALLPATSATRASRESLRTRISSLEAISALAPGGAQQVDKAVPPRERFSPQPLRAALFGFMLSLVLAMLVAYALERLNRRVKHLDAVGPAYRAPVLAALPHLRARALRTNGDGPQIVAGLREPVRGLRTNLRLASPDKPLRTFVVTSALPGEGKSTLVLNLALAYAESGMRVTVLECDLRLPSLAKLIAIAPSPGLTNVLLGECDLAAAVQRVELRAAAALPVGGPTASQGPSGSASAAPAALTVLTSGPQPDDPSSLLASPRMTSILERAREDADVVIIDAPPLLPVSDALPLVGAVDATIVVARIGVTTRSAARRVREILERLPGASLLGVVANDVPASELSGEYYGYGYRSVNGGNPTGSP